MEGTLLLMADWVKRDTDTSTVWKNYARPLTNEVKTSKQHM